MKRLRVGSSPTCDWPHIILMVQIKVQSTCFVCSYSLPHPSDIFGLYAFLSCSAGWRCPLFLAFPFFHFLCMPMLSQCISSLDDSLFPEIHTRVLLVAFSSIYCIPSIMKTYLLIMYHQYIIFNNLQFPYTFTKFCWSNIINTIVLLRSNHYLYNYDTQAKNVILFGDYLKLYPLQETIVC